MNDADKKRLLREMIFYRRFEDRTFEAYMERKIGGFLHLYTGQEAVATGVLDMARTGPVSYTHLTLPTRCHRCRSRWSPDQ